jgi:membrane-associated phospholipid phosphatase
MFCAALTSVLLAATPAEASAPDADGEGLPGEHVKQLPVSYWVDGATVGAAALAWGSTDSVLYNTLAPTVCRWCDRAANGTDKLNAVDAWARGARWSPSLQGAANALSSVIAFAILPSSVLLLDYLLSAPNQRAWMPGDLLLTAEAAMLATMVDQMVKFLSARQRPFAHFDPVTPTSPPLTADSNLSFFSGHTSFAFAMAVGLGTVAQLRGYRRAWLVWAICIPLATAVAYLRMAADVHYLSDVSAGAAVGALFGFAIPALMHGPVPGPVRVEFAPAPNGAGVKLTF